MCKPMNLARLSVTVLVAMLFAPGCVPPTTQPVEDEAPPSDPVRAKLRAEIEELNAQNKLLNTRLDEMNARERQLSEELNRLRELSKQLENQVRSLAVAPLERDAYKARCERLGEQVAELERRLAEQSGATIPAGSGPPETEPAP